MELDLQYEQAEQDRRQLTEDMSNYTDIFDLAPFAYLALSPEGLIVAVNGMASRWLAAGATDGNEFVGRRLEDLLVPECRASVRDMLAALTKGTGRQSCKVQPKDRGAVGHAVATATLGGGQVLMALMPLEP